MNDETKLALVKSSLDWLEQWIEKLARPDCEARLVDFLAAMDTFREEHNVQATYLIWSNEHRAWWGPGRIGYVPSVLLAGWYSRRDALDICTKAMPGSDGTLNEIPVPIADIVVMRDAYREKYPDREDEWL